MVPLDGSHSQCKPWTCSVPSKHADTSPTLSSSSLSSYIFLSQSPFPSIYTFFPSPYFPLFPSLPHFYLSFFPFSLYSFRSFLYSLYISILPFFLYIFLSFPSPYITFLLSTYMYIQYTFLIWIPLPGAYLRILKNTGYICLSQTFPLSIKPSQIFPHSFLPIQAFFKYCLGIIPPCPPPLPRCEYILT